MILSEMRSNQDFRQIFLGAERASLRYCKRGNNSSRWGADRFDKDYYKNINYSNVILNEEGPDIAAFTQIIIDSFPNLKIETRIKKWNSA